MPLDFDAVPAVRHVADGGFEVWYNVAVAPWLHVTGDVQYVDSALQRADSAWVVGARTEIKF